MKKRTRLVGFFSQDFKKLKLPFLFIINANEMSNGKCKILQR